MNRNMRVPNFVIVMLVGLLLYGLQSMDDELKKLNKRILTIEKQLTPSILCSGGIK